MKGLLKFFIRHQILFLFIFFEILSFYLVIKYNKKQNTSFFNSANAVYSSIYSRYSNVINYFNLDETNKKLSVKNAYLLNLIKSNYKKNIISLHEVKDSLYQQQYVYFTATVINNSVNKENNFLTLDKGYNQGVSPGDAVISSNGVVGIIKDVSKNYSTVLSILNKNVYISAKIKKNNYYGSVHWETNDYTTVKLKEISYNVKLNIGENFYNINVELFNNLKNLRYVYIVKNLLKTEQKKLEQAEND